MTLSIDRRADLWTDRVAAIGDDGTEHSYRDLAAASRDAARRLEAAGVGEGDAVALLARNGVESLALLFACRRLGAVLAPISHRLGGETVASLGERIDPALVLHAEAFAELGAAAVPEDAGDGAGDAGDGSDGDESSTPRRTLDAFLGGDAPSAAADDVATSDAGESSTDTGGQPGAADVPPTDATSEAPLLYLHTGGTTGVPKVVVVTRRQVEWNCVTEVAAWGLGKDDVAPVLLPLYHVGGWLLLTLPLLYVGGRIVLQHEFEPGAALAAVERHGATRAFGVAAIFQAMAEHERFEDADLSTLEWCMSGGGPTPASVIETYRDRGIPFVQGYGLTEGGPNDLYFPPERADEPAALHSVGRPFPDAEARLVDPDTGEFVTGGRGKGEGGNDESDGSARDSHDVDGEGADAATGELELRGPVTARRYLATEDGTFDGDWVSTGDLARRTGGEYEIVGRTDNMFVSGGENVYPEEIEAPLERHPDVAAAGVLGIPHERWGTVPKAVVVLADDAGAAGGERAESDAEGAGSADGGGDAGGASDVDHDSVVEELEAYLADRLAGFQVPRAWAFADELPRSGPGKLDRGALEAAYGRDDAGANGGERA